MSNEETPGVSLVVPVHGDAIYFEETIRSIREIEFKKFEIIIVLDRASEKTVRLAEDFMQSDARVILLECEEPGIVEALNLGISKSNFDFVARLDSDDLIEPSRLQSQLQFLNENPNVVVLGTQLTLIDTDGTEIDSSNYPVRDSGIRVNFQFQNCIAHPSVMFKKSIFLEVGGYRKFFTGAEDYDLWFRMSKFGEIRNLDRRLTKYRISEFQFTRNPSSNQSLIDTAVRIANSFENKSLQLILPNRIVEIHELNCFVNERMFELRSLYPWEWRRLNAARELNSLFRTRSSMKLLNRFFEAVFLVAKHPVCMIHWATFKFLRINK